MEMTQSQVNPYTLTHSRSRSARLTPWRALRDTGTRLVLSVLALAVGLLVVVVAATLVQRAWPLLTHASLAALLTGEVWAPTAGIFGFAPFIAGSMAVTTVAMAFAVGPAILSGIYLAEYTSSRARNLLKPMLDVLVGIPSVIFGLWGVLVIVPFIRDFAGPWVAATFGQRIPILAFNNPSGYSVLAGGLVLAVMVFPLIVAVIDEVVRSVPGEMREALLALGATKWEMTKCIVRSRGLAGIVAAVVLGFSRAFGETLAVLMVVGNVPKPPMSVFDAAYPLPALIANNYGEMMSIPLYDSALMGAALLLLIVVIIFNITARAVIVRLAKEG